MVSPCASFWALFPATSTRDKSHRFGKMFLLASELKTTTLRIQWKIRLQAARRLASASADWREKTAECWYSEETMKGAEHGSMLPRRGLRSKTSGEQGRHRPSLLHRCSFHFQLTLEEGSSGKFGPVLFVFFVSSKILGEGKIHIKQKTTTKV